MSVGDVGLQKNLFVCLMRTLRLSMEGDGIYGRSDDDG